LAFLCLEHHDEYDGRTRQSKGLQIGEAKVYRQSLYDAVSKYLDPWLRGVPDGDEPTLLAQGEVDFYLTEYKEELARASKVSRRNPRGHCSLQS
jgi:hypothetical protein